MTLPNGENLERWCHNGRLRLRHWWKATSLGVGLGAFWEFAPQDCESLKQTLHILHEEGLRCFPMGNGTNVVGSDEDFSGVVLQLRDACDQIDIATGETGAAVPIARFLREAAHANRGGLSRLVGIPGQLGGMLAMNAGALGQEIGSRVLSVQGFRNGEPFEWHPTPDDFAYRTCHLPDNFVITSLRIQLDPVDGTSEAALLQEELHRRATSTPRGHSAGSVFRNPPEAPAGKLLELAGCKGLQRGNLQVSQQHANWIVKLDDAPATASDCRALFLEMQRRVLALHGIELQSEWRWM
ncbi:MAG: FAD-binding protein [Victivallales bacterium]|nr:FAD-binding protein [Victivallales bacterium]